MSIEPPSNFYVAGGTLRPGAPSYVERQADQELYDRALAGDFLYVLTSRQMGKSSLMARAAKRLKDEAGVHTAIVDLTSIGTEDDEGSADKWYYGVATSILDGLGIRLNLDEWWDERTKLPALQRLTKFFSDIVLANTTRKVIIFVDEIDSTIKLPFADDFFAAIRACYNARATEPVYNRLSFTLLGVASPSDLIKDTARTPFNIGHRIDLTDFTFEEAKPLARGLGASDEHCEQALRRILHWTGGHPYLTQKLCQTAAADGTDCDEARIDSAVEAELLSPQASLNDSNLNFVRDRVTKGGRLTPAMLKLYRRIRRGEKVIDDTRSPVHSGLKLSGLIVQREDRSLRVRNRVYERVFTDEWARKAKPLDRNQRIAAAALAVMVLMGLGLRGYLMREWRVETLAVLPFVVTDNDPAMENLSDILTDRLINDLSQLPNLRLKSRSSVLRAEGRQPDLRAIGEELDVQALLVGKIAQKDDDLVIEIKLVSVRDNTTIWAKQYRSKFADLSSAEEEIKRDLAFKLLLAGSPAREQQQFEVRQLYQKARYYWNQRTLAGLQKAREQFQQALALDPDYAPAHAGIADCYNMLALYNALPPHEAFPKAKTAAVRALELDNTLAEAHAALALAAYIYEWDWKTAEQEFKRAIELKPTYASAHQWYSTYLVVLERADEAVAEAKLGQQLDPLSLIVSAHYGRILYYTGRYNEGVTELQKTLALDPKFFPAHRYLGQVYEEQGRYEQGIAELNQALTLSGGSALVKAELGHAYAVARKKGQARKIINELSNSASAYQLAAIHAALGEKEEAFTFLQKAMVERSDRLVYLKVDPRLKALRDDPRFTHILQTIGL